MNESLELFYRHKFDKMPLLPPKGVGDFNVFSLLDRNVTHPSIYTRYDFFKIMSISGNHRCHYADKSISLSGNTLLFFNPTVSYRFELLENNSVGFFCVFKEAFFTESLRQGINNLPMFMPGGKPVYNLNTEENKNVVFLSKRMISEVKSDYALKYDLLRNYVSELVHVAMKMEPNEQLYHHPDTNARITSIFISLLDRQFPIESREDCVKMRSANDFAQKLSVHVNHLNRAVRCTTGKTTTEHINERLVVEATTLLKHTDWNISEISDCLGFSQPAHFAYFFKKHTESTPTSLRFI